MFRALKNPENVASWIRGRVREVLMICLGPLWPVRAIFEKGWAERAFLWFFLAQKSQAVEERTDGIRWMIEKLPSDARVLEIGTFFGEGSTQTFLNTLGNRAHLVVMDSWTSYISELDKGKSRFYRRMDDLSYFAAANTLRIVKKAEKSPDSPHISIIRRSVNDFYFAENSFDLVYIDGSHYYEDVCRDIELALKILKPGGIICGDDLEMPLSEDLIAAARLHQNEDYIPNAQGSYFHPGVALAVSDLLGTIEMKSGFWWKTVF
jgi:predicted O-methyltransferase YrrM